MIIKLLTEHILEFLSLKGAAEAPLSLNLSKCHIVGNHMSRLIFYWYVSRQLTFSHRQALCEQLTSETEPAMTLHLTTVILFQKFTQNIIHIPGKCVPQVLVFLKDHLDDENYLELVKLQGE